MKRACRIGMVTPGWPGQKTANGIATSVFFLARGLQDIGVTPVILPFSLDGDAPRDIPVVPIRDQEWSVQNRLRARFWDTIGATQRHIAARIAGAVREASEAYGLDVILMEETHGWAGILRDLVPVPVIVVLHGPWVLHKALQSDLIAKNDKRREAREARAFTTAAGLIAPSRNVLDAVEAAVDLGDKPRVVLPNALPMAPATPLSAHQAPNEILFIGRFDRHKGGDTVLEAFARLTETHPDARLTFAGPDRGLRQPDGSIIHLADFLSHLPEGGMKGLTYKGPVDRETVAQLRAGHAIAVVASRYENLNYTLLEAMAEGQAIVSTAVGGPAEVLEDGKTALMVPPDDPDAMAGALRRLLDDTSLRVRVAENSRNKLERDFNPSTVAEQTVAFIEEVLNSRAGRA